MLTISWSTTLCPRPVYFENFYFFKPLTGTADTDTNARKHQTHNVISFTEVLI